MKRIYWFVLMALASPLQADSYWQKLTWTTTDGVEMVAFYRPAKRPEVLTWVLLHGLGSFKEEWEAFGRQLSEQGSGVFLYDARGHHESTHLVSGDTITYKTWQQAVPGTPWDAMPADLGSAVQLLEKKYHVPGNKIAVGGASLGANVALVYASQHPEVPALLLLSPGVEYAGINIQEAWGRYGLRPIMMAASPQDQYAYATVQEMCRASTYSSCPFMEGKDAEHGVNMFKEDAFTARLLGWMKGLDGNRNRRPS